MAHIYKTIISTARVKNVLSIISTVNDELSGNKLQYVQNVYIVEHLQD